jgi:hypothetical protein
MNIIARPQINGRNTVKTAHECSACKAAGIVNYDGQTPRLYELAETDAKTAAMLASLGRPVAPIADSEHGLFCLTEDKH